MEMHFEAFGTLCHGTSGFETVVSIDGAVPMSPGLTE
jgi:hypothetical protein